MLITINGTKLCEVTQPQLAEVVQLLGKDSFTFTMDQAHQTLNLMLPFQCYQVVLETDDKAIAKLLEGTVKLLAQARFNSVHIVCSEPERKRVLQMLDVTCPITWITISTNCSSGITSEDYEWRVQYSLNQMKQSKALAMQLVQNIESIHPTRLQGLQLKWKQVMNSLRAVADKAIPAIRLECEDLMELGADQLNQLQFALANTVVESHTNKPVLQVIQSLLALELAAPVLTAEVEAGDDEKVEEQHAPQETIIISKTVRKKFAVIPRVSQESSTFSEAPIEIAKQSEQEVSDKVERATEPLVKEEVENHKPELVKEQVEAIVQEVERVIEPKVKSERRMNERALAKDQSTFRMLQAHSRHVDNQSDSNTMQGSNTFMSYMNQVNLAQTADKRRAEQQKFNIMTDQHKSRK